MLCVSFYFQLFIVNIIKGSFPSHNEDGAFHHGEPLPASLRMYYTCCHRKMIKMIKLPQVALKVSWCYSLSWVSSSSSARDVNPWATLSIYGHRGGRRRHNNSPKSVHQAIPCRPLYPPSSTYARLLRVVFLCGRVWRKAEHAYETYVADRSVTYGARQEGCHGGYVPLRTYCSLL